MNYLTRHQIYLRVLPVLFISVMVLGFCSWMLFENKTLETASHHQKQELSQLATRLRFQVGRLAMSAELRKSELGGDDTKIVGKGSAGLELLSATILVDPSSPEQIDLLMTQDLDTPINRQILERWYQTNKADLISPENSESSTVLESDPWHDVLIFPPVFLSHGSLSETLLPLLVRQNTSHHSDENQLLLLVNLGELVSAAPLPRWLCLVDAKGRILWESDRTEAGVFAGMSGKDFLELEEDLAHSNFRRGLMGRWLDPWLISTVASPTLPVTLISAEPAAGLRNLILKYMAFVTGLVIFSLLGAVLGVMRVLKRLTNRLSELAESMSLLAKGEYSRRMPEDQWDEIGQLVGYFNLMAISLDEAHRDVKEKTVHLRAALENMRLLDKAKDDFLVLISHEVRTPLTAILGGVDFIKASADRTSESDKEVLKRLNILEVISIIQSSSERLSGFMTDAIQMTAIQSSDRQLELKATPVSEMIELGLCGIREKASLRGISVENQLDQQVWSILGDQSILKMALEKIFDNAVTHNREGGKIIIREAWKVPGQGSPEELLMAESLRSLLEQPSYQEWEDEDIRWRLIEVYNSGEPIPEGRRKALFGKFELVGRIEHHHKGSGLSLPIAQGAVECHGGRILWHSDKTDGNSFYLLLPTLLDPTVINEAMAAQLWDDISQGVGSTAGHKKVGQVADLTALKVKVDDSGSAIYGGIHQAGGRINGSCSSDHQKKVTIGSRRE